MGNLIQSLITAAAPFVRKPRLVAALLIAVITMQPNIVRAQSVDGAPATEAAVAAPEEPASTEVAPKKVATIQDTLLAVCRARGYDVDCAKTLLGMAWTESNFKADAKGDYLRGTYRALGWFQIHYRMHGITAACAMDLACSADWTISYMESNSYPKYPTYAIQCHNGCNAGNGYVNKVRRYSAMFWDSEIAANPASASYTIALAK